MMLRSIKVGFLLFICLVVPASSRADWKIDLESGVAISGYNDVRYPGDTGTKISLSEDLSIDPTVFWRARLSYTFANKHTISLFAAPLRFEAEGTFKSEVDFGEATFAPDEPVTARYRFDSYRLTYRYAFIRDDRWRVGIGFTGKIRDASISLEDDNQRVEKANTGFVPLINFLVDYTISPKFGLLLTGDALAAPQGRAEDVLLALTYTPQQNFELKTGYRILEGGADNDEVYTFALVNYIVAGVTLRF